MATHSKIIPWSRARVTSPARLWIEPKQLDYKTRARKFYIISMRRHSFGQVHVQILHGNKSFMDADWTTSTPSKFLLNKQATSLLLRHPLFDLSLQDTILWCLHTAVWGNLHLHKFMQNLLIQLVKSSRILHQTDETKSLVTSGQI